MNTRIILEFFRYLATGDSLKSMSLAFRIGISTTSEIIRRTCKAIWDSMQQEFFTPSQENWLQIHNKFALRWNFPHCVGALDGKHVVITVSYFYHRQYGYYWYIYGVEALPSNSI